MLRQVNKRNHRSKVTKSRRAGKQTNADHLKISDLVLEELMIEWHPNYAEQPSRYHSEHETLCRELDAGSNWQTFEKGMVGGDVLLALLCQSGPYAVSDLR